MSKYNRQRGSIELVALGFCAALIVLLAIPLLEIFFTSSEAAPKTLPAPPALVSEKGATSNSNGDGT